jgi:hypothetical protein
MRRSDCRRTAAFVLPLAEVLFAAAAVLAAPLLAARGEGSWAGSTDTVRDFMIENVCVDNSGAVLEGVSPIDGDRRCVTQRDLMLGEQLPYHKHDHPSTTDRAGLPRGYQRRDSFPVETRQFGVVVEHSFDFGGNGGRQFGVFDAGRGDGGDVALLSPKAASIAATEDGGGGFQLFVGPECRDQIGAAALTQSWIIALLDPNAPLQGETVARLADLGPGRQAKCPARLNDAFTRWRIQPVTYRAAQGQGAPVTLTTLVSEHYGGESPESAEHVERFYFTRELGSTRWERWQNLSRSRDLSPDQLAKANSDLALSGRCSRPDMPTGGGAFVMIDCREWTMIVAPDKAGGDHAGFFIDAVRSRHLGDDLFAAPGSTE